MNTFKSGRIGSLLGVAAVVLWAVGMVVLFALPSNLADNASDTQTLAWYQHNTNLILAGGWTFILGCLSFLCFLGVLRTRLAVSEGGAGTVTTIAFVGGVATTIFAILMPAFDINGAISKDELTPAAAGALHQMGGACFVAAELALMVLLIGVSVLGFSKRVVPRWFGVTSLVLALILLIGPIGWAGSSSVYRHGHSQ
ncbi:MAG: hypothetical protein H0X39_06430 [Actinobacteria bacterium]|nr:hypothetical protein [Actinomycetota bacterium]